MLRRACADDDPPCSFRGYALVEAPHQRSAYATMTEIAEGDYGTRTQSGTLFGYITKELSAVTPGKQKLGLWEVLQQTLPDS